MTRLLPVIRRELKAVADPERAAGAQVLHEISDALPEIRVAAPGQHGSSHRTAVIPMFGGARDEVKSPGSQ